ncbi:ribonuclease P [Candidatus Woesearchaeota archaeon]|nr:ribonuclease P [Candidatus Woesearchaeota archaeon]
MAKRKRKKGYGRKPDDTIKIANQHIASLLEQAKEAATSNPSLADRYVALARKVAMKFRIRMQPSQRRLFCPHCYRFMLPSKNLRVRVHEHRVIYYCLDCKKFWRRPLGKKRLPG